MVKKELRIGLIGTGFMARAHSNAYKRVGDFFPELEHRPVLKAVCSRTPDRVKSFAEQWRYKSTETDWKVLVNREDIDAIDICSPNDTHAEIALAAAAAGKMILCEKPLARTVAEAQRMYASFAYCLSYCCSCMDAEPKTYLGSEDRVIRQ